jgi:hypothetical protein
MTDELMHKAESRGDQQMIEIINNIILVPHEIRTYVLKAYLRQCIFLYNIAFVQSRLMME